MEADDNRMELSLPIQTSQHPVPSPDGCYIALASSSRLEIRSATTCHLIRSIQVGAQAWSLTWSHTDREDASCPRIAIYDEIHARVWDLEDERWTVTINNGSGGMGKIANIVFGRTREELLVFSEFGAKLTIWDLSTKRTVEIRDPKFSTSRGFGYRPGNAILALLSRSGAQDVLTLHAPGSNAVIRIATLPTIDAQMLRWSKDGRWLAIAESASVGYKIFIYTADGNLFRTYSNDSSNVHPGLGLGIRSFDWNPRNDCIALAGYDRRVAVLSTRTFSPQMFLDHTPAIQLKPGHQVWQESVSASSTRTFTTVTQPIAPPTAPLSASDPGLKTGISLLAFNADGTKIATRDDAAPTTVWIWDLPKLAASTALIQHSPVKHLSWHPTLSHVLLVQCTHDQPTLYIYDTIAKLPYTVQVPLSRSSGKLEARWLPTPLNKKPALLFGDAGSSVICWPDGKDVILRFEDQEEVDDSLFEVLTGKAPRFQAYESTDVLVSDVQDETEMMDDTFVGRRVMV